MIDATRHYDKLALLDPLVPVAEIHAEAPLHHQEHLVLVLMMVKYELAHGLHQLDVLSVEFTHYMWFPAFGNFREFFGNIDLVHNYLGRRPPQYGYSFDHFPGAEVAGNICDELTRN